MRCRAVSCPAVRCRAVPRCAVLCIALLCFLFRRYQMATLASIQSWREPACPRRIYSAVYIFHFFGAFFYAVPVYRNSSTAIVCTCMYVVIEPRAQQSTARHSAITPAQSSKPCSCRSEYVSKEVCTYMHAASRLFSWSTELLAFASRLFAPNILDHLLTTSAFHSNPFFLVNERSGRNLYTGIQQQQYSSSIYECCR